MQQASVNFAYLAYHDQRLVALATQAEEFCIVDPPTSIAKLRLFAELLAKRAAARVGLLPQPDDTQLNLINRLHDGKVIGATQQSIFHDIRRAGNAAVHENKGDANDALHHLRMARELAVWFQRTFGNNRKFDPGPFVPPSAKKNEIPPDVVAELTRLKDLLASQKKEAEEARQQVEAIRHAADEETKRNLSLTEQAAKAKEEAAVWEAYASEQLILVRQTKEESQAQTKALEDQKAKLVAELAALQAEAQQASTRQITETIQRAAEASEEIVLDEAATRKIIDHQLRAAGWEVDSSKLTYPRGTRPEKGKNRAIAEWPTFSDGEEGRADYVLFVGLQVVGVVEAKKKHSDVVGVIPQAKRYSRGYLVKGQEVFPAGSPWCKDDKKKESGFRVPFLFTTNGRPYLRQLLTKSGIWFLDARRPTNHPTALEGWYTPDGLLELLKQDVDEAHAQLKVEPMPYIDREYQKNAIHAVEKALEEGKREILLAMATGTGKTRTCIGLMYRLLKTKRFRRVLFLVDRTALGDQTTNALKELRLENLQTFTEIFAIKELGDMVPDRETKLHIATVQAMVRRVLANDDERERDLAPVDQYDCIIVDECHRGYLLDREMSQREFEFRDEDDYISKYRRVLDHFDAVKIGLTATPAIHTTDIFGKPVFNYSYREAVIDGFLIDHEPPIRIITKLAQDGIHYTANEEVTVLDRQTQTLRKENLPDNVDFEIEEFNRRVITPGFTEAVLTAVANEIDPESDEKTLIFAATDEHADRVVVQMKEALRKRWGEVDDNAVAKITGTTDKCAQAIRRYRNERHPNIVVTVDLLTTGIDIPKIANLVFLRRVRSRILYEQMIGRATRLCPEINKERFRIFDAVELYSHLKELTDMKPVVVNPMVSFEQLVSEIVEGKEDEMRQTAILELLAKLQRKKRVFRGENEERFVAASGHSFSELVKLLKNNKIGETAVYLSSHKTLAPFLDKVTGGGSWKTIVSDHADEVREIKHGFYNKDGSSKPPQDYLDAFAAFIKDNENKLQALRVVTQRPRDLTREDLRQLKLLLDTEGFNEVALQTAWREQRNEDIAATIIGDIRQLALGSPLRPFSQRVDDAVARLEKKHNFKAPQKKWLQRIAKQIKLETVVDRASIDAGQFQADGGFKHLNKAFDGKLEELLGELSEEVWRDAS